MLRFLPHRYERVLEIGCGEGAFSSNLKPKCEIWGVEMNKEVADTARRRMHKVLVGKVELLQQSLPDNYFDLVICNDVIEHMEDHETFLTSIRTKMTNNSYLVGSVPNIRYYFNLKELLVRKDWKYTRWGILDATHQRFFTELSLKCILETNMFSIDKFEGINRIPFDFRNLRNFLHKLMIYAIVILSLGYHKDVLYLQFGFCVKKHGNGA